MSPETSPTARVHQVNVSPGGVPKTAVPHVTVTHLGIQGDKQRDLEHHGGPERAVCLYSLDLIEALQAEGHPIFPGAIGENICVSGLDWQILHEGLRLRIGETVRLQLTGHAGPCSNLTPYFADGDFSRVSERRFPGWSRYCARVLAEGTIAPGDAVVAE